MRGERDKNDIVTKRKDLLKKSKSKESKRE